MSHIFYYFQAGINSGYQEKPCLNPYDPDCPASSPNKYSKMVSANIPSNLMKMHFRHISILYMYFREKTFNKYSYFLET